MSAFLVNKAHIDALVAVALYGPADKEGPWDPPTWFVREVDWFDADWSAASTLRRDATPDQANAIGQLLYDANAQSIKARYGEDATEVYADEVVHYRYRRPAVRPTCAQAFKLCHCLNYQSCEYQGWQSSEARRFLDALEDSLARALPGYDEAPWEWPAS